LQWLRRRVLRVICDDDGVKVSVADQTMKKWGFTEWLNSSVRLARSGSRIQR